MWCSALLTVAVGELSADRWSDCLIVFCRCYRSKSLRIAQLCGCNCWYQQVKVLASSKSIWKSAGMSAAGGGGGGGVQPQYHHGDSHAGLRPAPRLSPPSILTFFIAPLGVLLMESSICRRSTSPKIHGYKSIICLLFSSSKFIFEQNKPKNLNKKSSKGKMQGVSRLCPAPTPFPSLKPSLRQQLNDLDNNRQQLTCHRLKAVHLWVWSVWSANQHSLEQEKFLIVFGGLSVAISRNFEDSLTFDSLF